MAKRYEVIGAASVEGHAPGEKFHADLDPKHEARMLRGGFLRVAAETTQLPERPKAALKPSVALALGEEAEAPAFDDKEEE